jgi:Leucine-rich repeat (LRR) protein
MRYVKLLCVLVAVLATTSNIYAQQPVNVQDSLALVDLYDSTNGPSWANWYGSWKQGPVETWSGVTVTDGRVTRLDLHQNNLIGSVPASFGNLTNLIYLDLGGNQLSSLPESFSNLTKLTGLGIDNNRFTFATLEWIIKTFPSNVYISYAPQNTFKLVKAGNTLMAPVGGTPKNNTFYWYRGDKLDTTIKADSTYTPTKVADYRVEVTNALVTGLVLQSDVAYAQLNVQDSLALVDLYDSTNGPGWANEYGFWKKGPVNTWYGVTVTNGRVISLMLGANNLIGSLPASFGNLTNLDALELNSNQLSSLPASFGNFTNLGYLTLNNNQLSSLPASFGNLTNLYFLDLNNNQLSSLPASFGNLTGLGILALSYNQLSSVPTSLGNLMNLEYLYLDSNQLSSLPASFGNLTTLTNLSLNNNQLSSLPASLGNLTNLKYLGLNSNQLSSLPELLGKLTNLNVLELSYNQLSSLPASLGNRTNLTLLNLGGNQLSSVPTSLGNLTNLGFLYLNSNQLSSLPASLSNLTNLGFLELNNNQLTSLPASLGKLTNLQGLDLTNNQLSSLPESLGNLTNLYKLYLDSNRFTFTTLEWVVQKFPFASYTPQDTFKLVKTGNTLMAPVGGTPENNTFYWYRDDKLDITIKADSTYMPTKAGNYRVEVTNAIVSGLVLQSDVVSVTCKTCTTTWYRDADGDGWGNPNSTKVANEQPRGYVANDLDCNDKNKVKGGPEVCDGIDNNCDGIIDDGLTETTFYSDFDGDGYGSEKRTITTCAAPPRYVAVAGDRNDDNKNVYPGAPEICDGRDNNQNGEIDEGFNKTTFYHDFDKDGYGRNEVTLQACAAPLNYVAVGGDCNDRDASIHPGAKGPPNDGIDNNCNGLIDEPLHNAVTSKDNGVVGEQPETLLLTAQPNPSTHYFTLRIQGSSQKPLQLRVLDELGRVVEVKQGLPTNSTIAIGHNYRSGIYIAEVVQDGQKATVKLMKTAK